MQTQQLELLTSPVNLLETSDLVDTLAPKRAIISMKIINKGPNNKNLEWIPSTMQKVASMFRGVPFRYDLTGQNEGSHTKDHLSSPFYDVGWTYSDERGAYYDPVEECIWVKGEVTHPEVIKKLQRATSEGKREINFGSMGAMLNPEQTMCSICHSTPFGSCEHQRGETYNGEVCNMVPLGISKALHVALTNDPADRVAEIADAVFQDMTTSFENTRMNSPVSPALNVPGNFADIPNVNEILKTLAKKVLDARKQKTVETMEDTKMDKDSKEEKKDSEKGNEKLTKDNEKSSEKEDEKKKKKKEDEKPEVKEEEKKETADMPVEEEKKEEKKEEAVDHKGDKEEDKKEGEKDDEEDDEEKKKKKKVETADNFLQDDDSIKITGPALKEQKIILQEAPKPAVVETADATGYADKYKNKLILEVADSFMKLGKASTKDDAMAKLQTKTITELELFQEAYSGITIQSNAPIIKAPVLEVHDNSSARMFAEDVPEFGGASTSVDPVTELQDMSPSERRAQFGEYGAFDLCFNPHNVSKYKKQ